VEPHAVLDATPTGLGLELTVLVAIANHVETQPFHRVNHVEEALDPLVPLQAPEKDHRRLRRLRSGREVLDLDPGPYDPNLLRVEPVLADHLRLGRLRDRRKSAAAVDAPERKCLERIASNASPPAHLVDIHRLVHVVDQ